MSLIRLCVDSLPRLFLSIQNFFRSPANRRLFFPVFLLAFCLLALIPPLLSLHLGELPTRNNTRYHQSEHCSRGLIFDRNGNPLAVNEIGWRIFLDPLAKDPPAKTEKNPTITCKRIAELTGLNAADVYRTLANTNSSRRYIVQGISYDPSAIDLETNKSLYLEAVGLERVTRRLYPQGRRFAHILGFLTGHGDDVGGHNGGVEQFYDDKLTGTKGFVVGVRANNGSEIRERRISSLAAIDGANIYLTIDHNIQLIAYEALSAAITEWNADGGRIIIQHVDSGEILAMVSLPDFDPMNWRDFDAHLWKNRTITDVYDPGSTMKSVTVASALQAGIITPDSLFDVGQGFWVYGGSTLRDHAKGIIDTRTVIMKSSNIGAAKIGLLLGNKRFEKFLFDFGFKSKTGIDLPNEARGILMPAEKWEPIRPTRVAMGQGISVTPIQMINAYSTIANGGKRMRPYIVNRIVSPDGKTLQSNSPRILNQPISEQVSADMREMLALVLSPNGTARRARVPGYSAAGKTGTAQIPHPNGGYYAHNHWASFIGFVPAEKPVFSMLVLLDNPTKPGKSHDGGVSAAPVFSEIASAVAQYLEIPSSNSSDDTF